MAKKQYICKYFLNKTGDIARFTGRFFSEFLRSRYEFGEFLRPPFFSGCIVAFSTEGFSKISERLEQEQGSLRMLLKDSTFGTENEFGDLYAKVKIIIPKNLSQEETELFEKLLKIKNLKQTLVS